MLDRDNDSTLRPLDAATRTPDGDRLDAPLDSLEVGAADASRAPGSSADAAGHPPSAPRREARRPPEFFRQERLTSANTIAGSATVDVGVLVPAGAAPFPAVVVERVSSDGRVWVLNFHAHDARSLRAVGFALLKAADRANAACRVRRRRDP